MRYVIILLIAVVFVVLYSCFSHEIAGMLYEYRTSGLLLRIMGDSTDQTLQSYHNSILGFFKNMILFSVFLMIGLIITKYMPTELVSIHVILSNSIWIAIGFFILIMVSKFNVLNLPYNHDALGYVVPNANAIYGQSLWPFPRLLEDTGHPFFYFECLALTWKIFGQKVIITHLVGLLFVWIALFYTYLIGKHCLNNSLVGVCAAIFLLLNPLCLAQFGMLHLAVPLTALIVMSVYYLLRKKYWVFIIIASLFSLTKAYAFILVIGILVINMIIYDIHTDWKLKPLIRKYLVLFIPVYVYLIWFILHYRYTGVLFNTFGERGILDSPHGFLISLVRYMRQVLMKEHMFLSMGVLVLLLKRKNPEIQYSRMIYFLVTVVGAVIFILSLFKNHSQRYIIPAYPFWYLWVFLCMNDLWSRYRNHLLRGMVFSIMILTTYSFITGYYIDRAKGKVPSAEVIYGNPYQDNMEYIDVIRTHQKACEYLESEFADERILSVFPISTALRYPYLGYVTKPMHVVTKSDQFDVIAYTPQGSRENRDLKKLLERYDMRLVKRFEKNCKYVEIWIVEM